MKQLFSAVCLLTLLSCNSHEANSPASAATIPTDRTNDADEPHDNYWYKSDIRKKDSLAYTDFSAGNPSFTFNSTPDMIITKDGLQFTVKNVSFTPIPQNYKIESTDSSEDRNDVFRLAIVEIEAKNISDQVLKFEAVHPAVSGITLFADETGWRPFHYSTALSMGSLYIKTDEPQKSNDAFKASWQFFSALYNPGQIKSSGNCLVYVVSASARTLNKLVLSRFEPVAGGGWASVSYACTLKF
jgi:hypothetical protein